MIVSLTLVPRLTGQINTQPLEGPLICLGEDHGGVHIAALEPIQLLHSQLCHGAGSRCNGQGNQGLISVEPGIPVVEMVHFQVLNGAQDHRGNQVETLADTAQGLESI